jgi:hypothetical protein
MTLLRRISAALIAPLAASLAIAAPAVAWAPVAMYDVPGGGVATCLRDAGGGAVTLFANATKASTAFDALQPDGTTFTRVGTASFGP